MTYAYDADGENFWSHTDNVMSNLNQQADFQSNEPDHLQDIEVQNPDESKLILC